MRQISRALPAPTNLTVGMIGVPEGAEIELQMRLEAVMEGVLVTGTANAPLSGECSRCLDPLVSNIEVEFQELFFYSAEDAAEDDLLLDGELLDLESSFRDAVVLALPLSPVCGDDCPGLCVECGVKLADAGLDHEHEKVDARWAALQTLHSQNENNEDLEG
jgi:uncharacterized protein